MERGRTGDVVAATDEKEAEMDDMSSLPSRVGGMVYNSLELMQMQPQPPKAAASPWLWATTDSLDGERFSFWTGPLEGPLWPEIPQEAMLVSVVHAAAPDCIET